MIPGISGTVASFGPQLRGSPNGSGGSKRDTMAKQYPEHTARMRSFIDSLGQTIMDDAFTNAAPNHHLANMLLREHLADQQQLAIEAPMHVELRR